VVLSGNEKRSGAVSDGAAISQTLGKKMKSILKFTGTADRFEWWATSLITSLIVQVSVIAIAFSSFEDGGSMLTSIALVAVASLAVWITLAVTAKRFRDCGYSPWLTLLGVIPFVCFVAVAICGFVPGARLRKRKLVKRVVE